METTIDVVDVNEFKYVKPANEYIPNFMRVLAATRFAYSSKEWINIFKTYSSGTYSSQWMLIDYNKFKSIQGSKKKVKELLYVVEQNPKHLIYHDISEHFYKVNTTFLNIYFYRMNFSVPLTEPSYLNQKLICISA